MTTITIMDPVTRIEGHMKVELTIETLGGVQQIVDARCTGTLFRGFEKLLEGRDPKDAPVLAQRICGVCPISHGLASVLALDAAAGAETPANGRILRNLTLGANYLQSHILHFYLLAALDYVKGPEVAPWAPAWDVDMRSGMETVAAHLPQAIEARRLAHEMGSVFGGRMPTAHAIIPGGFTCTPTSQSIDVFRQHLERILRFIRDVYMPDVNRLAAVYSDYSRIGGAYGNLLAFGVFAEADGGKLLPPGIVRNGRRAALDSAAVRKITESVAFSWYRDTSMDLHPSSGATDPLYPKEAAYSWLKAPRLESSPFEVGPLARMYVSGHYTRGISVMDRHAARAMEAMLVADAMFDWLDQLEPGAPVYQEYNDPVAASGAGLTEAPRGALGHWVQIETGKLKHYQIITPTCWNASPRDGEGVPGPMEKALIGTPIQNAQQPVEALRIIHSFDPCLSCAVHVMQPRGKAIVAQA